MTSTSLPPIGQAKPQAAATSAAPVTMDDLAKVLKEIGELKKAKAEGDIAKAQAISAATPPPIDWTKITEKDIIDMSLDIPVIEQDTPEYMNVHLLDKNYIPRWIHTMSQRLGVCLASGYSYVTKEDFDPKYPIFLNFDTNNHYSSGDVVCLKILKSRYYPAIKANYLKTMAIHGKNKLHTAVARGDSGARQLDRTGNELKTNERVPEVIDPTRIHVYDPGDEPVPGEHEYTREMVS